MSDTPRTDERVEHPHNVELDNAAADYRGRPIIDEVVPASFARELERENAQLREENQRLIRRITEADAYFSNPRNFNP